MFKNFIFTVLALIAGVGLLAGAKFFQINDLIKAGASMVPPPTSVSTTEVLEQQWEVSLESVGTVEAVQGVLISADLTGRVASIEFEPGTVVKAGDVLVRQDTSSEQAQLRAALATADLAKANLARAKELVAKKVASAVELDTAEARYKEAIAAADTIRTTIAKKTIVAPFDGNLGIRQINLGQDLASGSPIVSLQAINALHVNFSVPQKSLAQLKPGLTVRIRSDALPGNEIFMGEINAIDPQVDTATRSVQVQATFTNTGQKMLPGMFASVEIVLPQLERVLAVPKTAIAYSTYGDSLFVVEEVVDQATGEKQLQAKQYFVQLGRSKGDYVAITKGVEAGNNVVSAGVFKLRNGAAVAVNNAGQPEYHVAPVLDDA